MIDIQKYLPHRPPFLMVDDAEIIKEDSLIITNKYTKEGDWYFDGHFPEKPVFPGVLMIEFAAQSGCILVSYLYNLDPNKFNVYLGLVSNAKFFRPVFPSDIMTCNTKIIKNKDKFWKFRSVINVKDTKICECEFTAILEAKNEN